MSTQIGVRRSTDQTFEPVDETNPFPVSLEGQAGVFPATGVVFTPDGLPLTPKYAVVSGATSGNNTLVAAVPGKKIRVLQIVAISAGTTTFRLESGADGTALTGVVSLAVNTGFTLPFSPVGWCETVAGALLNMELNAAIQVSGVLAYIEV
jgi:hypothetical protein